MSAIAFLGLGNMGAPMSANLVAAEHIVRGFDPMPAAASAGAAGGATIFDSAADAVAEADVVITMLPNGDLVKRCYADVLPAAQAGALFIDSSTISVNDAREVHSLAESHGVSQLDAPVSGDPRRCRRRWHSWSGRESCTESADVCSSDLGGQDHSLRCGRGRASRQDVQQHGAGGGTDRDR
jgi:6-phosphogluconate dehydrogenase (decarboxylating)